MVDALLVAYVAVSNVPQKSEDGEVLAPTKATLVPRLEPITAVLGLRLEGGVRAVRDSL